MGGVSARPTLSPAPGADTPAARQEANMTVPEQRWLPSAASIAIEMRDSSVRAEITRGRFGLLSRCMVCAAAGACDGAFDVGCVGPGSSVPGVKAACVLLTDGPPMAAAAAAAREVWDVGASALGPEGGKGSGAESAGVWPVGRGVGFAAPRAMGEVVGTWSKLSAWASPAAASATAVSAVA
ncbi:MAG: hypothetical protein FRX49_00446 [Trebouxia sp. A1-2]|nr:MAG: hypothetical protein FRX49_00446 [Trebouxia sp. A1-2]